jgi:hypothetical protein
MKYTDKFFRIPVKMYDNWEMIKAELKEEAQLMIDPELAQQEDAHWVACMSYILPEDIIGYDENFSRETDLNSTSVPDMTIIQTKTASYPCLWKVSKFEQKLNEFMEQRSSNSINIQKNQ